MKFAGRKPTIENCMQCLLLYRLKFSSTFDVEGVKVCSRNFEENGIDPPKPNTLQVMM